MGTEESCTYRKDVKVNLKCLSWFLSAVLLRHITAWLSNVWHSTTHLQCGVQKRASSCRLEQQVLTDGLDLTRQLGKRCIRRRRCEENLK